MEVPMPLPPPLDALWNELQSVRAQILKEVEPLSQAQADWRPGAADWSPGEIVHHLMLAEIGTGKLTSKLLKAVPAGTAFPADLRGVAPVPPLPPGAQAPDPVRPEHGQPFGGLLADFRAARDRSRETFARLAGCDPRTLTWPHPALGTLDLAQWWALQARHDAAHLDQLRAVKASPGFPRA
jgi:hypothetical protein